MVLDFLIMTFIRSVLLLFGQVKVSGLEHVPSKGPYILVINHVSLVDPPMVLYSLPGIKLRFFAGEKWEKHLIFGPLMRHSGAIYIRRGEVDRKALRLALEALNHGEIFGLAPEGTRSRVGGLIKARDGAAFLATRAKVPIVPMALANTNSMGRNAARLRRTAMDMVFGEPFQLPDMGRAPRSGELAAYTHYIMIHLAALLPDRQKGYYAESPALAALEAGKDPWPLCLEAEGITPSDEAE